MEDNGCDLSTALMLLKSSINLRLLQNFQMKQLDYILKVQRQLKPKVRQQTLNALEYTLSHIFLEDRRVKPYEEIEEKSQMVAENTIRYNNKLS